VLEYLRIHLAVFVGNANLNIIAFGQRALKRKKKKDKKLVSKGRNDLRAKKTPACSYSGKSIASSYPLPTSVLPPLYTI